ncbi:WD repeat domain-containing protein [Colletotrichum scovillei]|uniref:WD repeat domain-containing protein n=1 Tax=Colletotrichum scovillei TaxID=1209932 RepID=A0A9P7R9G3_9PEZI|nr:WD repeat domain-containing protein [Colletotrichum scovillei]KAG7071573.1 WD repeat domain-containing protein [Colletotrichum scovillei]KAG7079858.1 WD repeat domain-containing protein [Colletotrichum scovillei]
MTSPQPPRDDSKTAGLAGIPIPTELVLQIVKAIGPRPKPQPAKHIRLHGALEAEADSDSDDLEIVDNYFYEDPNKPTQPDVLEGITDLKNLTITCRALYQMLRGVLYQRSGQEDDWYALRWASFNGNLRALEAAVEAGASVNYAFEKAGTPIDMMNYGRVESTFGSNFPMLQRSKTYNFGTPLLAAAYGDVTRRHQAIKWLLSHGADPNTTDANGITPLHVVCRWSVRASVTVELLLKKGADANALGPRGWTPLHMACYARRWHPDPEDPRRLSQQKQDLAMIPTARELIRAGADLRSRTTLGGAKESGEPYIGGLTPYELALYCQNVTMVEFFPHITDIFSLATTSRAVLSASGSSTLHIHDTADPTIPITQSISGAHKLGCHHICTSRNGLVAASAGFAGEVKIWVINKDTSEWKLHSEITNKAAKAGEVWAIALSEDGKFLAGTTYDGRVNVWDVGEEGTPKIREYETGSPGQGSFGMSVDLSRDGRYTASGHQNGAVYVFNNDNGKLLFSLPGLVKSVRSVAFSPGNTRLAAAGDSSVIALYDIKNGEQVSNMTGHSSWITSVDWNDTGEYLLSGAMDGKVKVWSVERSACVATHSETDKALWAVKWLPKTGKNESFCTAGANRSISFYREATGA